MKKISLLILIVCIISLNIFTISAENTNYNEDDFLNLVKETIYYKEYENKIIDMNVLREADTTEGKRFTVQFVLENKNEELKNLVFIGDEKGEILGAMIVYSDDSILSLYDLIQDTENNVHLGSRGPVYICSKYTCTEYETKIGIHNDYGCSSFIGRECNYFNIIKKPIIAIVCKLGVWVACKISIDKVCTDYYEELDVCEL